jgi:hypothetical protein
MRSDFPISEEEKVVDTGVEFIEKVYEIAFGDDAINKDYSPEEVLIRLKEFSDNALKWEEKDER